MRLRLFLFRFILLLLVLIVFEGIGYWGMWLNSTSFDFLSNKNYFKIRAMLTGNKDPELFPRYLSLPYLGYVPYPGYKKYGVVQHNEDGYRGNQVPLLKTGKFRILCLGGSTTYGLGVDSPSQTFPARLEALVNDSIFKDSILNKKYKGAEVINAGVEAGTSAEELQQYLFKYRYYHADAVIINSGINDALLASNAGSDFQLDYTHHRRLNFHLEPLPIPTQWLLKSYFISFISIRLFYSNFSKNENEFKQTNHTFCRWSDINRDSLVSYGRFEYYPFYENSRSLYAEVAGDSTPLIIIPGVLNKNSEVVKSNKNYADLCDLNSRLSKSLADQFIGIFVPFDFNSITDTACWIDDCHLNAKGEENKARILYPFIIAIAGQCSRIK